MGAATQVSVEEYLRTVYRPDCDYVDGVVEERNVGERDHASAQTELAILLNRFRHTGLRAYTEFRMRVRERRYRVPDVLLTRGVPDEPILTTPPLLCVEVLSPEDKLPRVEMRIHDYLDFGVPVVWLIDPVERRLWIYRRSGVDEITAGTITLDGTAVELRVSEIFG